MTEHDGFMEWARQKGQIEKRLTEQVKLREVFKRTYVLTRDTRECEYLEKMINRIDEYIKGATFVLNVFGYRVDIDENGNARMS